MINSLICFKKIKKVVFINYEILSSMIHADYNIGFFILTRMNHKNNPENILLFLDADHMKYIKVPIYRLFNN